LYGLIDEVELPVGLPEVAAAGEPEVVEVAVFGSNVDRGLK